MSDTPDSAEPQPPITLDRARRYFLEASNATRENDLLCERDVRYYHGDQLSSEARSELRKRKQPAIVFNVIKPSVDGMFGIIESSQTSPECLPRSYEDQNAADIATKVIRYLSDCANLEDVERTLSEDFFIPGTCAVIVGDGNQSGDQCINVTPILWQDFFYDPLSRMHDFSDARYLGVAKWFDADELKTTYPEAYDALGDPFDSGADWLSGKHSADAALFLDTDRRRVRVIELHLEDENGTWQRLVFCNAGWLDFGPSLFKDDKGYSICPIAALSYAVNRSNQWRYGAVRPMVDPQDEINSRRSKLLQETNNRRVQITSESADPTQSSIAKREAARADGVMPFGYEVRPAPDVAEGQNLLLQQSQAYLDRLAPTPAVLSRFGSGDSGRAREILQQAGLTEWSRAFSRFDALKLQIYKRLWYAARQFITQKQTVRITNEARAAEFEQINVPEIGMVPTPVMGPDGQPVVDPNTGQPAMHLQRGVVGVHNAIAQMDVDIIMSTVPKTANLEQEVVAEILRYASSVGISPLDPQFKALLMMFPLADKQKTIERFDAVRKEMLAEVAPQQQMQQQQMQQQQALQAQHITAKAQKDQAQAQKASADAAQTELEIQHAEQDAQFRRLLATFLAPHVQPPGPRPF